MMLVLASPATARDRQGEGGEAKSFRPFIAAGRQVSHVSVSQSTTLDSSGLEVVEDPGAPRLFGSLPVAANVDMGVGLFSVVGLTEKEQVRRRLDPAREYLGSPGTRVAAVGMSLRF
jgi:hypothetical protein